MLKSTKLLQLVYLHETYHRQKNRSTPSPRQFLSRLQDGEISSKNVISLLDEETNIGMTALVNACTALAKMKSQKSDDDRKITTLDTQKAVLDCEKASLEYREFKVKKMLE